MSQLDGGEEVCTVPVGVLMVILARKPDESAEFGGDLLQVAFSKTKQGWVREKDEGGLLLEFREDPALEPEPEQEPEPEPEVETDSEEEDARLEQGQRHDWASGSVAQNRLDEEEAEAKEYIEHMTGSLEIPDGEGPDALYEALKDGARLCAVANAVRPGVIKKVNTMKVAAMQMENIGHFLDACVALGLDKAVLFRTPDLWDGVKVGQNRGQVTRCILRLQDLFPDPGSGVPDEEEDEAVEEGVPPKPATAEAAAVAPAAPAPEPAVAAQASPRSGGRARQKSMQITAALSTPETEVNGEVATPITQADLVLYLDCIQEVDSMDDMIEMCDGATADRVLAALSSASFPLV